MSNLGKECKIFIVPGNHDVDRKQEEYITRETIKRKSPKFLDPSDEGRTKRQAIMSRFRAYAEHDQLYLDSNDWLSSSQAYFTYRKRIKNCDVGILGVNTSWFAEDDHDKGQLTPGKNIIEAGLEAIADADVKIVLGHHPIDWFSIDDCRSIRALFGKHKVIYLHGHMHQNESYIEMGAGHPFINVQSGAAFQAREHDIWVNGLLWGEWNAIERMLELEPYCWSNRHQEWSPNVSALPNAYQIGDTTRFAIPLIEGSSLSQNKKNENQNQAEKIIRALDGWELITRKKLKNYDTDLDDSVILSYFDGRMPNFGLALCPKIPRRTIVYEMTERLNMAITMGAPTINMILGAGGEGKTTAFLQIIEAVLMSNENWQVVHCRGDGTTLSKKMIDDLPKGDQRWLIASDDADLIANEVHHIALSLQNEGRDDVHFLLSSRFTDWRNTKVTQRQWARITGYHEEELRGLSDEDAVRVVDAWNAYKEKGLGRLAGLTKDEAVEKLVEETRLETSKDEGAFLGALLQLRFGDQLKNHVRKLLNRLSDVPIQSGNPNTLLHAFAYISVMHAENRLFLSKEILSKVLGVQDRATLRSKVLYPLGKEAAADVTPEMVFTRHRAIAETAVSILATDTFYRIELDDLYVDLVGTAEELYHSGHFITNLAGWRYLSDHFFDNGNTSLAIRLAQTLLKSAPTDSFFRVKLAQLFRKAGQSEQALKVFRDAPRPDNDRAFFTEWAVGEGHDGNHAVSVWLNAVAMADETAQRRPSNKDAEMFFSGLAISFHELFERYNRYDFIKAAGISAQLCLSIRNIEQKTSVSLKKISHAATEHNIQELSPHAALKFINEVTALAYKQREADLPKWIPTVEELTFHGLAELLGLE